MEERRKDFFNIDERLRGVETQLATLIAIHKEKDGNWTVLATNYDVKPLEEYLPDIVYSGEDRMYWKECDAPIYENLYLDLYE